MYQIDSTDYGFRLTVTGRMDQAGIDKLSYDLLRVLSNHDRPFGLLVDLREMIPLKHQIAEASIELHAACRRLSMVRGVLVVKSRAVKSQFLRIGLKATCAGDDLIIDAGREPNWEDKALSWLTDLTVMDTRRVSDTTAAN